MATATTYLIALGSNRPSRYGGPAATLTAAFTALPGRVTARSAILTSDPIGPSLRRYANAAALIDSEFAPPAMLDALKAIERDFGRRRGRRWGARTLDLDIVLWSGGRWRARTLTIPHAAFRDRDFVLTPAAAIAPDWRDPLTGLTLRQLRTRLTTSRSVPRSAHRW